LFCLIIVIILKFSIEPQQVFLTKIKKESGFISNCYKYGISPFLTIFIISIFFCGGITYSTLTEVVYNPESWYSKINAEITLSQSTILVGGFLSLIIYIILLFFTSLLDDIFKSFDKWRNEELKAWLN
jgi:Trk-type K+ transport system membrane component